MINGLYDTYAMLISIKMVHELVEIAEDFSQQILFPAQGNVKVLFSYTLSANLYRFHRLPTFLFTKV